VEKEIEMTDLMRTKLTRLLSGAAACALLIVAASCGGGEAPPAGEPEASSAAEPAAATGPTGTAAVTGTVTFDGQAPNLRPLDMAADPVCAGKHDSPVMPQVLVLGEGNTMGWVFVKVSAGVPEGSYPPPSEPAVIDQNGCVYHPHVLGMMAGQELKFLNSDGILHNVHGLPKENREFNLGMPATVTEQSVTLNRPEPLFTVKCDVHPWMNAYVAVMTHPFWAVTGENGAYAIGSLPAGTYTIEAWHERLGQQTSEVTVADGETATADFAFATPAGD
jgi:plastocyanin